MTVSPVSYTHLPSQLKWVGYRCLSFDRLPQEQKQYFTSSKKRVLVTCGTHLKWEKERMVELLSLIHILLLESWLLGGFGALLGGYLFHHKVRKWYFRATWWGSSLLLAGALFPVSYTHLLIDNPKIIERLGLLSQPLFYPVDLRQICYNER